jgi:mRNA interferase RelE/StbE
MSYKLKFIPSALKEWQKLDGSIREQFKKRLAERLENPQIPTAKLSGYNTVYKIKLRTVGYRLVYEVIENEVCVYVVAVGKRDKDQVYQKLADRLK